MSTGSPKPNRPGAGPLAGRSGGGDTTDLTVALPAERPSSQVGTDPPTHNTRARVRSHESLELDPTKLGDEPADEVDAYVGKVLSDRYRILRKIGEGGMGTVYLAEHVLIEKKVAIKILSEDLARKGDLVTRFMQEAKAASRIGHENIVDITDFGQTDAKSVFFAMEYLEGSDLATIIRQHSPMPIGRVQGIVNQICRALGAAHGKGIIHRDMKPENIFLIERDGRQDFVKILDFGIAKMSSLDDANERLTRTGMIFGTPEYMSPEQARGDRPDHRVDIYALGCILYEMLTGDVPFHAETFMGILTKHMFETPDLPRARAPQAQIPPAVEAVVMRALAKNRDERYQSMREFAVALAMCSGVDTAAVWGNESSGPHRDVQHTPTRVAMQGSAVDLAVEPPRSRTVVWVAVAVAMATIATTIVLWPRAHPGPPPAVLPAHAAEPMRAAELPAAVEPPATVPAAPTSHGLTIESEPPGAEVFVGDEQISRVRGKYWFDHSSKKITLTIRKRGFRERPLIVTPDHDGEYKPKLELLPKRGPPPVVRRVVASPAPESRPVVKPAEPPKPEPPKPEPPKKRQQRDLMDPFPAMPPSGN